MAAGTVVVTGASTGIGAATSRHLADLGYAVPLRALVHDAGIAVVGPVEALMDALLRRALLR
ncbi:hypothetical protein [Nocardioides sp. GXQ0305]|uniref:hypothetical protein n=1 Tax=Nocardioides sp. GXQ0305 TaxID=3423912 RepID=UPI003D7ED825